MTKIQYGHEWPTVNDDKKIMLSPYINFACEMESAWVGEKWI